MASVGHSSNLNITANLDVRTQEAKAHLQELKPVVANAFNIDPSTLRSWTDIGRALDKFGGSLSIVKDKMGSIQSLSLNMMNSFGQMQTHFQHIVKDLDTKTFSIESSDTQLTQQNNILSQLITTTNKYTQAYREMTSLQDKNSAAYDIAKSKVESYAQDIANLTSAMQKNGLLQNDLYASTLKWSEATMQSAQIVAEETSITRQATPVFNQLTQAIKEYNQASVGAQTDSSKQEVYNEQLKLSTNLIETLQVRLSELGVETNFENGRLQIEDFNIAARALGTTAEELEIKMLTLNNSLDLTKIKQQTTEQENNFKNLISTLKEYNRAQADLARMQKSQGYSSEDLDKQQQVVNVIQQRLDRLKQLVNVETLSQEQQERYNIILKEGEAALAKLNRQQVGFGQAVEKNTGFLGKMATQFKQVIEYTVLWSSAYRILGLVTSKAKEAVQVVKDLDSAMVDLQMATGDSRDVTADLIKTYNSMAKELGSTTTEVAKAADTWLRMGYTQQETNTLIKNSMVLSKVGQLESAEATQYLVSAMKGFDIEAKDSISIVDKLSAVDLVSATSAGGLATAMSRTAESAKLAGVSINDTIGYIAAVAEVTQKSEESIGESFKTIFARLENVKAGVKVDEEGNALNDVEKVLTRFGISLRDSQLEFRNMGDVLDEINSKWKDFTSVEQAQIATAIAGKQKPSARMYSNIQCFAV